MASTSSDFGKVGHLDEGQTAALCALRSLLEGDVELYSSNEADKIREQLFVANDHHLLRFLRAREFDVEPAADMVKRMLVWRRDFHDIGVRNVTLEMVEAQVRTGKSFHHGHDCEGHPVNYVRPRFHNKADCDRQTLEKFSVWSFERGRERATIPVEASTMVYDMTGFGYANMDSEMVQFLIKMFSDYYPETMHAVYVVDAGWLFWGFWAVISPFMDTRTSSKIHFISRDELKEKIGSDNLIAELGGNDQFVFDADKYLEEVMVRQEQFMQEETKLMKEFRGIN